DSTVSPPSDIGQDVHAAAVKLPESAYFGTIVVHDTLIVFNRLQKDVATGFFAIPLTGLNATLQRIVDNDAVIPAAITHGKSIDSGLVVEVALAGVRLAHRGAAKSAQFHSKHAVGTAFGDMTVAVGLSEALAPDLVIGGLPGSRLPFLIGIVVLSLLLLVIALVQLHQREKLARLREDFVAGTSHELRTPLAQIRLFAETLRLERVRSDSERNHALIVIEREARRLEHLVENLLHFSRAERGTLQIATEALNLAALTREIVSEFLPLALKADVTVVVDAPSVVSANVDAGAWRQIVLNLLDNATKYGGGNSRVVVRLENAADFARLTIDDEGPGVDLADRERIWKKFWRGDAARAAGTTGTGIGLATVRDLVLLHGGSCFVDRNVPRGARFHVHLPMKGPVPLARRDA
ncbi:MAG: HAMP domain-containing sensor histidine kinase, partial [Gemmatimonadaceae bacterium]